MSISATHTQKIVALLAENFKFDKEEALAFLAENESTTSLSTVQKAENALANTLKALDAQRVKIDEWEVGKKEKLFEKAKLRLQALEDKLEKQKETLKTKQAREAKAKDAPPPKPKKAGAKDEPPKRLPRMNPTYLKQLNKAFEDNKVEWKKEYSAEFVKFINEMDKEMFENKNLADHMPDFVATKKPVVEEIEEETDEDMVEVEFKGKKYVVGETSKKVYIADEENGDKDTGGFLGLGQFKGMKFPKKD